MSLAWLLLAFGVGGALLAGSGSSEARVLGALRRLPRTAIRDAREGRRVRLVGRVRLAERPLSAPLSGRPCAGWVVRVEERLGNGWAPVLLSQRVRDFFVEDGTGRALVSGERLRLAKRRDVELEVGAPRLARPEVLRWLGDRGVALSGLTGLARRLRCCEGILDEGAAVAVSGPGRWEPDVDPLAPADYRQMAMRLTVSAGPGEAVLASDLPEAVDSDERARG